MPVLQRKLDVQIAEEKRIAEDINRKKQQNLSREQREHELAVEKNRYLDNLFLNHINGIGVLFKENNGSLTTNPVIFALARVKA